MLRLVWGRVERLFLRFGSGGFWRFAFVAFVVALVVRAVPEVLAGPYPVGLDTLRYVRAVVDGWPLRLDLLGVFKSTRLFFVLASFVHVVFGLDAVFVMKVLGPFLAGVLGFLFFAYGCRVLRWGFRKSFAASVFASVYFMALVISGSYFRQLLGMVFFMGMLVVLFGFRSVWRFVAGFCLGVLVVLSHEIVAVLMLVVLGVEVLLRLWRRDWREFIVLALIVGLVGGLFLFQRYSPAAGGLSVPLGSTVYDLGGNLAFQVFGLVFYCYVLLLPLAVLGFRALRHGQLLCLFVFCFGVAVLPVFSPFLNVVYWWRWVYVLVYPLAFCAAEGLAVLFRVKCVGCFRRVVKVGLAVLLCGLVFVPSFGFLVTFPEDPFPFFGQYNPFLVFVPSSLLQNAVSVRDNQAVAECFGWLNGNMGVGSVVVVHEVMCEFAFLYLDSAKPRRELVKRELTVESERGMGERLVEAAGLACAEGFWPVYTVWWVDGKGWYQLPWLPREFVEVVRFGNMGVFVYAP